MATLATKPYLVASLNIMVAARRCNNPKEAFTDDEITEILMMMATNDASTICQDINVTNWQHKPPELI